MKVEDVSRQIRDKADLLQEINTLLGNVLSVSDSFRVVGRELFNIIPFKTAVLYGLQPQSFSISTTCASGANSDDFFSHRLDRRRISDFDIFALEEAISISLTNLPTPFLPSKLSHQYKSILILPLPDQNINFGLMAFYESPERPFNENALLQLEVLRPLISELMLKAYNTEKSRQLTTPRPIVESPKGFFIALQTHLEECLRSEERSGLTVFNIEIRDFAEIENSQGAPSADFLMNEISKAIRNELRRLDVVSRISKSEILVSLPTVSALERNSIAERIKSAVGRKVFYLPNTVKISPELVIGSASLGFEGETAAELLYMASLDTRQQKVIFNNSNAPSAKPKDNSDKGSPRGH